MRYITSAQVICDDCQHALARAAIAQTPDTPQTRAGALAQLTRYATRKGWRIEGPNLMAGDLCPSCARRDT